MSGIFDALFTALGRPEGERGHLNPRANQPNQRHQSSAQSGHEGRRPGAQTAPPTPRVGNKAQPAEVTRNAKTQQHTSTNASANTVLQPAEADSSFSTLADVSTETTSTLADVQVGPQPLPYVYHRRSQSITQELAPIGELPSRNQRYRRTSSAALTDRPSTANAPRIPESAVIDIDLSKLSDWRQEQLMQLKPARLVNEGKVKTLSSLHGPLSLPYARNPSGVDATAGEHNHTQHGNLFGLRSVPRFNETDRVVSNATNGTRSTSCSSMAYLPYAKHKQASDSEQGKTSTVMVRDTYQTGHSYSAGHTDRSRQHKSNYTDNPMAMLPSTRSALNPTSSPFTHKVLARRALGVGSQPPTIEASAEVSPAEQINPLVEAALAHILSEDGRYLAQYDEATIARLLSTAKYYGVDPRKVSSSSSNGSRVPSLETSSSMSSILSKMPQTPGHSSKADHSANWRSKGRYGTPDHETPIKATATSTWSPPGPVMTIDELMAKFSPGSKGSEQGIKFKAPSPVDPAVKEKDSAPKSNKASKASGNKSKIPLIEVSANVSPATSPKPVEDRNDSKKSTAPKGTPGAGKLLKKQYVASPSPPPMPQLGKSSGKLGAIAEKGSETGSVEA